MNVMFFKVEDRLNFPETEARAQMNMLDTPKDHMLYRTIKLIESSILGNYLKGEYQF